MSEVVAKVMSNCQGLTGLDKAAILMLSLPKSQATIIFQKLHEDEVRLLSLHMANLGSVNSEVVEELHIEFTDQVTGTGSVRGNYRTTEKLLSTIFDERKATELMEEIRGSVRKTVWDELSEMDETILANYLKKESPQIVAIIMSKIKPAHTAKILSLLSEDFSTEIISRMLKMKPIHKDILDNIETTLREEFISDLKPSPQNASHKLIAEIFNALDRKSETKFMGKLEKEDLESAEIIKSLRFTFDDIIKLDSAGIQAILPLVDKTQLALALEGATDAIKELFFENMSARAAKMLRKDMENIGPTSLKEINRAQSEIVSKVRELVDDGQIVISKSTKDEEMIA